MHSTTPMFSVVIPTYNRAALIRRACESVLTQSWRDLELIVVDDGSTDDTAAVVGSLPDERVRYHRCDHRGVSATRNEGATVARGRYLVFLDSDDVALPSWLELLSEAISNTAPDLAVCGMEAVGEDGMTQWRWSPRTSQLDVDELAAHFQSGQVALRRELFVAAGGFAASLRFGENTELALRVLCGTLPSPTIARIPEVLVRVRPAGFDEDYRTSRIESAAYVLEHHRRWRRRFPKLWASYHAIIGVDQARSGRWGPARRHFAAAFAAHRNREHAAQLAVSLLPATARAAWPTLARASRAQGSAAATDPGHAIVLFVAIAPGLGGSTRSLATLLGHLHGTRRVVACPSPTAFTKLLDERGLFEQRVNLPGQRGPRVLARASAALTLAVFARRHRRELTAIHANGLAERTLVALASLLSRKPVVVWVHDWSVSPWSRRLGPLLKFVAPATRFAAVSDEAKAMLLDARLATSEEVVVVPNPIDPADVRAAERPPQSPVTVSYLGTPAHYKGFHLLPSLIRSLTAEDLHWILYAGPETLMPEVWQELHALPGDVEMPGKVKDVREAYARCDIVVCPSLHESFGRVVAEAMANGIAVVASDLPPLRRLLGDNEAGLLVPTENVPAAAAAIRELAGNAEMRERMGQAGALRAKRYEPAPVVAMMTELYGLPVTT